MTKKILLLNPPGSKRYNRDCFCSGSTKGNYSWQPTDLLCLSGILNTKHQITVLDATVNMMPEAECFKQINKLDIDTIIFLTGTASWYEDSDFIQQVKETKKCKVIGIGNQFMFLGKELMEQNPWLDAVLLSFVTNDILDYLAGKKGKINNVIYRLGDKIISGGIVPPKARVFSYPVPKHELFPIDDYHLPIIQHHPFMNVLTSLGCVHKCSFCVYGNKTIPYVYRNVENTIEELKALKLLGIKEIRFMDYSITINKSNIDKLCRRMIEEKFGFRWHALGRVDEVDVELLTLMKASGCQTLLFGVESGDQDILNKYSKGITLDKIRQTFNICKQLKIDILAHFIIGLPGDTEESINQTIDFCLELDPEYADFAIATPYLGTKLRYESIKNNWIDIWHKYNVFSDSAGYPIMTIPGMTEEQVWQLKNKAIKRFFFRPSYIMKRLLKTRSVDGLMTQIRVGLSFLYGNK